MKGFVDPRRAVLRLTGADARPFLQDLVTNDIGPASEDTLVWAALLTPQGKYLFDFMVRGEARGGLLLDVDAGRLDDLARRLTMYRLRRKVTLTPTDLKVALLWGEGAPPAGAVADPRNGALGWRLYAETPEVSGGDAAEYDAIRVAQMVPEAGADLIPDDSFILEAGFERLNGVDFRKGCYVGQEVTARMKHKTELRKGLIKVALKGEAATGEALTAADGKPAGRLGTVAGDRALAHVRFDRAEAPMTAADGAEAVWLRED